jgi:hypothetical protein
MTTPTLGERVSRKAAVRDNAEDRPDALAPLSVAAQRLRCSREVALRHIMTGKLRGGSYFGRWMVDVASLNAMIAELTAP